jgi:hypothetical protein
LFGHREFVLVIGSDAGHAIQTLDSIKTELEMNDLLHEDFPEATHSIRSLEGIALRCHGQTFSGIRTHVGWLADEVILPTIPGSKASGGILRVAGITGRIRGMSFTRPDGRKARPSLAIIDDPQTDEVANSPSQVETRERVLAGAVVGLAGPKRKIAGIMPCTVIAPGDLASRMLDRQTHSEWNGERTQMVNVFPIREDLWRKYAELRADSFRKGNSGKEATEFYKANREEMDRGSEVSWPERYNEDEISGIQHAMNLKLLDARSFASEYQNDPLPDRLPEPGDLTAALILSRINQVPLGQIPHGATHLTAFVDVQASLLWWAVAAWEPNYTGAVVAYGAWPQQKRAYYTLADASPTLADVYPSGGLEARLYAGLEALAGFLLSRAWPTAGGGELRIGRCLVDAAWGESTAVVKRFCRQSPHAALLTPSHGRGIGASGMPMDQWQRRPGDQWGLNWVLRAPQPGEGRLVTYDANAWKSFLVSRLNAPMGAPGALTLWGDRPEAHRMLADHLMAEYRVRTAGRGREVDEWKLRVEKPDNHLLDCLVGCCLGASILGVGLAEMGPALSAPGPKRKLSEVLKAKREKRFHEQTKTR